MPLEEHDIRRILDAYLEGKATPEEEKLLDTFFQDHKNEVFLENLKKEEYALIEKRIHTSIKRRMIPARRNSFPVGWAVAASITILVIVSFLYLFPETQPEPVKPADVAMLHRVTEKGQKLTIKLPDGSVVKLNANSTIFFPEKFIGPERNVSITGEAFFDVVHDPSLPFVVNASQGKTTVLGTTFNIKDRSGKTQITLVEGKVNVTRHDRQEVLLKPNQQATLLQDQKTIDTLSVDVSRYIEWKDNVLAFDQTTLQEAALELEQWYGVEILIANKALNNCRITGRYESESLENVLESFQFMLKGKYTLNDKKVTISGNGCK